MNTRVARLVGMSTIAVALTATTAATVGAQSPADQPGSVRVVHGLRGLVADVYLDGTLALPTFQPERATDPIAIPAGDHLVEIRAAGAAQTDTPLLTQTVTVPAGFAGSLIAHLDAEGNPTLSAYADDVTPVPAGQSRLVLRHAAAAVPVDVSLDDRSVAALAPDTESASIVAAGDHSITVTAAGGGDPLAPPQDVSYAEGTANFMYLIGSQAEGTLGWAAVQVSDLQTPPSAIQTGDGSTMTEHARPDLLAIGAVLATLVAAIAAASVVAAHRPSR